MINAKSRPARFSVLGIQVNAVQILDAVVQMERWISDRARCHFIAVTGMHGLMEAQHDPTFKQVLNSADLLVPDGMPLVWLGRWRGYALERRVYGPELMETFCRKTGTRYRHFFYGGALGVPDRLANILQQRYAIQVAGAFSPRFRPLTDEEDSEIMVLVQSTAPDVLWVGLGTPKQERWMLEHRDRLKVPVMVGVGAAFNFVAGTVRQAPPWMREHGLEWFFRLTQEPRRLWRRYLIYGSKFTWNALLQILNFKKFE